VLISFLEKRVIDSDSFNSCVKEPKSGGNWRGKNLFGQCNFNIKDYVFGLLPNTSYTVELFGLV
jgi:hypothetical protein